MFQFPRVLLCLAAGCCAPAFLASSAPAAPRDVTAQANKRAEASKPADPNAPPSADPEGERWRYRFYHGRWWYWLPSERWVIWNGKKWIDHHPYVALPESSATWNDPSFSTGLDWSHFEKLDLSDLMPKEGGASSHSNHTSYAGTSAPIREPASPLARARGMSLSPEAVLDRSRWSLNVSSADRVLEDAFWPRSFYYGNQGYFIPGYHSPLYRYRFLPPPVGQFNYATGAGGYMGGALTPGMANGFLNRWP